MRGAKKLTVADARQIAVLCRDRREIESKIEALRDARAAISNRAIAEKFDISEQMVKHISCGHRWKFRGLNA